MTLFIGCDLPESKVRNAPNLVAVNHRQLKTNFIKLGSRVFPWHIGLIRELRKFNPDVILCEGESHFAGYLQAIWYKLFFNRRVALMHWCFISLPGWPTIGGKGLRALLKAFFRRFFDAFVVYSSFSKECLQKLGQPGEKIFVAINVGDIQRFIAFSDGMTDSKSEARAKLGLPERFTVLYTGTLDEVKRPEVFLDLAKELDRDNFNFVLLGGGALLEPLKERAAREGLSNVFLPGRVTENLPLYHRAADVLLIPGRGGIVISEAMAFGLPVIVHEADGTEYDLIQDGVTGLMLKGGRVKDFREALEKLVKVPSLCAEMGQNGERLLKERFTTENMVRQIVRAGNYAKSVRSH